MPCPVRAKVGINHIVEDAPRTPAEDTAAGALRADRPRGFPRRAVPSNRWLSSPTTRVCRGCTGGAAGGGALGLCRAEARLVVAGAETKLKLSPA